MTRSATESTGTGKSRDAAKTRAAILEAATEEFVQSGFSGARTSQIAKRARVPQGLLYHYFENKEDLFRQVLDLGLAPYFQATTEMLERSSEPSPGLLAESIRLYFEFLRANPRVVRLMTWWYAVEGWRRGLPIASSEVCHKPTSLGVERIRQGQEAGGIRADIDPHTVIDMFVSLCMYWHISFGWACTERGVDPDDPAAVKVMHDQYRDQALDLFLRGVLTPTGWARYEAERRSADSPS
jgi:AcrR family transcriptional regulator